MKKTMIIAVLVTLFSSIQAQTVNNVPISEIDVQYIQIVGTSNIMGTKVMVSIDFGQENKLFSDNTTLKDQSGKIIKLNSMIDALNFMDKAGYKFVNAYAIRTGNINVYHYILQKK